MKNQEHLAIEHNQGWVRFRRVIHAVEEGYNLDTDKTTKTKRDIESRGFCKVEEIPEAGRDRDGNKVEVTTFRPTDEEVAKRLEWIAAQDLGFQKRKAFESRHDYDDAFTVHSHFCGQALEDIIDRLTPSEWASLREKLHAE